MISFPTRPGCDLTRVLGLVMLFLVGKRPTDWISKMSVFDEIVYILDNRAEFDSFAESAELESLEGFELEPVEFEPYDNDGMTTYGEAN